MMQNCKHGLGKFYGVGVGPGDPGLLTLRSIEVLRAVDTVFSVKGVNTKTSISGGLVDSVSGCVGKHIPLVFSMARKMEERELCWQINADVIVAELRQGHDCAFVTIGDPLLYSTYTYLLRKIQEALPELEVETVPGITAFQAVAARQNRALVEDREVLAVVPAWSDDVAIDPVLGISDTVVFLKTYRHKKAILEALKRNDMDEDLFYAERIGLEDEMITNDIGEIKACGDEYLSLMIARRKR